MSGAMGSTMCQTCSSMSPSAIHGPSGTAQLRKRSQVRQLHWQRRRSGTAIRQLAVAPSGQSPTRLGVVLAGRQSSSWCSWLQQRVAIRIVGDEQVGRNLFAGELGLMAFCREASPHSLQLPVWVFLGGVHTGDDLLTSAHWRQGYQYSCAVVRPFPCM